jgi:hypothetical protein
MLLPDEVRHPAPIKGKSQLADEARHSLEVSDRRLTLSQRLEAFLEHNELLAELHRAGRVAEKLRVTKRYAGTASVPDCKRNKFLASR